MGYPKQVYKKASAELLRRREDAASRAAARSAEIHARIPQIALLEREMAASAMSVTKLVAAASPDTGEQIAALRDKNLALQAKRRELLTEAGYPADYLDAQKACEFCGGSGYKGAERCACFQELLEKEAYAELSAVSQVKNCTFGEFNLDLYPAEYRAHMAGVLDACKRYAAGFAPDSPSLLMIGQTGLGKTHLSLAIAGEVTRQGFGVVYTPTQRLTDKLEASKFSYAAEAKEKYLNDMEHVLSCDLLVLDDLGAEFITQFSASALYNIVNTRLVENKPSIISTNLEPAEIESKYAPRMLSRLMGGYRALKFSGRDIRFIKKTQRP